MDVYHLRYYKINKILLTCIGQWPFQSKLSSRSALSLVLFLGSIQLAPQIMAVVKYIDDPEIILDFVSPFIINLVCFSKLITCMVNSKKMFKMLKRISDVWKIWARDREVSVLHEYAETGRKLTVAYTVGVYSTLVIFITQPVVPKVIDVLLYNDTKPGEFPFPVYFHQLDDQKYYFYIIGCMYVCSSALLGIAIASDSMFIVYVQHGCGIFTAVGQKLKRIGENEESPGDKNMELKNLATCIDRHNDAIEFAKLIEATYSGTFFFIVGFNMIIISVTGLQIFTRSNEPQNTIRYIAFIGIQVVHLFMECYISQILMDHSTSIRDYIHDGKWYNISIQSQKLLNLIMMRSNIPCKLTAGKICDMSVETFASVIKTSMSYFTILRSMQ